MVEIREWGLTVHFTQGLDIRFVNEIVAGELAKLKISNLHRTNNQIHFAWDRPENEPHVLEGIKALGGAGIKPYRLVFYILTGYDTTWDQDWHRFEVLRNLVCEPYIMCFEGADPKLKAFQRYVIRKIYRNTPWEDYQRWGEAREAQQSLGF